MQPEFIQPGKNRQSGDGDQLAGGMGNFFTGIHLTGYKQRQIPGQIRIEGPPEIERFFALDIFKIQPGSLLGFGYNLLVQRYPPRSQLAGTNWVLIVMG